MNENPLRRDMMVATEKAPGQSSSLQISLDFLVRIHLAITALIQYIEAVPPFNALLWFADNKTPVTTLPDFQYAREAATELEALFQNSNDGNDHLQMAKDGPGNSLMYAVRKDINGTVTLTTFEGRRSASIDLNHDLLRQLITILERHAR